MKCLLWEPLYSIPIPFQVVWINQNEYGQADILDLEAKLKVQCIIMHAICDAH